MKKILFLISFFVFSANLLAQSPTKPRLVVGIVVDQMRYDYIYKYWDKYSKNGFRRMIDGGVFCRNAHYNYMPTYTGPGHASIYTGTTPATHGIVANDWYDRGLERSVYCAEDTTVATVGSRTLAVGRMSAQRLLTTTITDELKMATQKRSKVVGVSVKDRGAILPAGHAADAAYWFDDKVGAWVSSTYYMQKLPDWLTAYNKTNRPESLIPKVWNTLLPIAQYTESAADDNAFETIIKGKTAPTFPYNMDTLQKYNGLGIMRLSPFGNTYTARMAEQCVKQYEMGRDSITDFLTVSFSCTDYAGHAFGPQSVEVEDVYLRLDRDLAELLNYLDTTVGKDQYTVFLTADHAAIEVPDYLKTYRIPSGRLTTKKVTADLEAFLSDKYKLDKSANALISEVANQYIYLDNKQLAKNNLDKQAVCNAIADWLAEHDGVAEAWTYSDIVHADNPSGMLAAVKKGFMRTRSGDVAYTLRPGWSDYAATGTTHGSGYAYDTHVPIIFYGKNIKKNTRIDTPIAITDIAPTLALLLQIQMPSGSIGVPIPLLLGE